MMFDFKRLEETITIEKHDKKWAKWFEEEKVKLENIFGDNLLTIEHYGSSAVPGLWAKPIVDILVGLKEWVVTDKEKHMLKKWGYEYFGQLHEDQPRHFARKRGKVNFNLAIVPYPGDEWDIHILVRDYLRTHPEEVKAYSEIKQKALNQGKNKLLEYSFFKDEFVKVLLDKAQDWKGKNEN